MVGILDMPWSVVHIWARFANTEWNTVPAILQTVPLFAEPYLFDAVDTPSRDTIPLISQRKCKVLGKNGFGPADSDCKNEELGHGLQYLYMNPCTWISWWFLCILTLSPAGESIKPDGSGPGSHGGENSPVHSWPRNIDDWPNGFLPITMQVCCNLVMTLYPSSVGLYCNVQDVCSLSKWHFL
jgi:hypothetical protein